MKLAARWFARGAMFVALAASAYLVTVWLAFLLLGGVGAYDAALSALVAPSWLDVVATGNAAALASLVPSSRLRVLPLWLTCGGLVVLRVHAFGLFTSAFAFGPGAYPIDVPAETLALFVSSRGLVVSIAIVAVGLLAAIRPAPTCAPGTSRFP